MNIKLHNKTKELSKMRIKLSKKIIGDHGYSILKSSETLKDNKFMYEISAGYDNYGFMSQELGEELDNLYKDDNYIVGIHRTGYTPVSDEILKDVFNKGLINNGHITSGAMAGTTDIESTVSLFYDFPVLVGQLKVAHNYKVSEGCFILRIPKSYLGKKDGEVKPIYYMDDSVAKILPEFIYGYVPVDKEGRLGNIVHNPKYRNEHTYNNDNLLYDNSVMKKIPNINNQTLSTEEKYNIIKNAYQDTLNKRGRYQADSALMNLINRNDVEYFSESKNRELLSKYIVYQDILSILGSKLASEDIKDINSIIQNFISDNGYKEEPKKYNSL